MALEDKLMILKNVIATVVKVADVLLNVLNVIINKLGDLK